MQTLKRVYKNVMLTTMAAAVLSIAVVMVLSIVSCFTAVSENVIARTEFVLTILIVMFAGWAAAKKVGSKGIVNGFLVGALYFVFVVILAFAINGVDFWNKKLLTLMIATIAAGVLGGIVGVNSGK